MREQTQRGQERLEAAKCTIDYLEHYKGPERDQIPFQLLGALAHLTQSQLEEEVPEDEIKFTARDLIEKALKIGLRQAPHKENRARWLNDHWKKLLKLMGQTEDNLVSFAQEHNFAYIPSLDKEESKGGPRNRSYYRLLARPVPEPQGKEYPIPGGGIRYRPERRKPSWLSWLLHIGVPWGNVRKYVVLGSWGMAILISYVLVFSPLLLSPFTGVPWSFAAMLQTAFGCGAVLYVLFGPAFWALCWKIAVAPMWLTRWADDEPLLLEPVKTTQNDGSVTREIQMVRYTGTCSVCGGRVVVGGGGLRFWGRLVGHCANSPREHVFTFDHVTRVGRLLC